MDENRRYARLRQIELNGPPDQRFVAPSDELDAAYECYHQRGEMRYKREQARLKLRYRELDNSLYPAK